MKRNYLIIVLGLLWVQTGFAQDKLSDLFSKLDGKENVTQVTITKSMLNMMPDMGSSAEMNGVDVKKIVAKLEQIDIFTSNDAAMKKLMVKEATEYFAGNKAYEVLMRVKDDKDKVVFYGKKDNNLFTSLVMFVNNENDCTLIRLLGKFTPQDIQDVTKKATEK
ncbi:hypothetical protein AGMMS50239_19760 [Bacteroidia bacterium]|nr:hypothetical protein AGMMS50239_19760 [Bacteroidia bacterium]